MTSETFTFEGAEFHVAPNIGLAPMLRFAMVAKRGLDANELDAMVAMHELLRNCIHADDFERFLDHATDHATDGDGLMEVVGTVMAIVGERPPGRSSDSSGGPRTIVPTSAAGSSSAAMDQAIAMYNEQGRGDLALMVRRRQESLAN